MTDIEQPGRRPDVKRTIIVHIVYLVSSIVGFTIAGVGCRIALLNVVTSQNFFPESPYITVNFLGSFLMGIFVGLDNFNTVYPYLFTGLTVGFCGSFTTFSSWVYSFMHNGNPLIEVTTGIAMPFFSFLLGYDFVGEFEQIHSKKKSKFYDRLTVAVVALAAVVSLAVIGPIGGAGTITSDHVISCALGPIGSLTRWGLCLYLNPRFASQGNKFKAGTFLANAIAVVIVGALNFYAPNSIWTEYVVTGITGSLSTVSSWVADTMNIHRGPSYWGWSYVYCASSVLFSTIVMIPFTQ